MSKTGGHGEDAISTADCPYSPRIRLLLQGSLDQAGQAEMSQHLDHCVLCQAQFEHLANDSAFFPDVARDYNRFAREGDGPMQQVIEELGRSLAEKMATTANPFTRQA